MPHDRVLLADTKAWLAKASNDLRAAGVGLKAEPMLLEDALFHCQQAIEKSFKAFLTFHDRPFRKTHNLEEIERRV
jgi:HEPN domain-containing protein